MKNEHSFGLPSQSSARYHVMRRWIGLGTTMLCGLLVFSCAAMMNRKDDADRQNMIATANGIMQACQKASMASCEELRLSFECFSQNDPGAARQHLRVVLENNEDAALGALTDTLTLASQISGSESRPVQRFSVFMNGVVQGNKPTTRNVKNAEQAKKVLVQTGCTYDAQCKFDRVCINGECISGRFRAAVESRYMAASKGVIAPTAEDGASESAEIELELLSPRRGQDVLLCRPEQVLRCMKKCEKGSAENCYAVGKLYEQLPATDEYSEYLLFAYQKACGSGMMDACIDLANLHFYGRFGERNMSLAYQYHHSACNNGNGIGCINVARLLKSGKGVTQDAAMADEYYMKACACGESEYCITDAGTTASSSTVTVSAPQAAAHRTGEDSDGNDAPSEMSAPVKGETGVPTLKK
ncbi:MAG: sel1 repeat family protein [Deltaproteobacteria bacterium]|nr:sel1 repeat family protein [Deltaproteobacteria bacterium]